MEIRFFSNTSTLFNWLTRFFPLNHLFQDQNFHFLIFFCNFSLKLIHFHFHNIEILSNVPEVSAPEQPKMVQILVHQQMVAYMNPFIAAVAGLFWTVVPKGGKEFIFFVTNNCFQMCTKSYKKSKYFGQ